MPQQQCANEGSRHGLLHDSAERQCFKPAHQTSLRPQQHLDICVNGMPGVATAVVTVRAVGSLLRRCLLPCCKLAAPGADQLLRRSLRGELARGTCMCALR